jgi:hypothetical protein
MNDEASAQKKYALNVFQVYIAKHLVLVIGAVLPSLLFSSRF